MKRSEMKNYNTTFIEKQQKYQHIFQPDQIDEQNRKFTNLQIFQQKKHLRKKQKQLKTEEENK